MKTLSPEFRKLCSPGKLDLLDRFSAGLSHFQRFASGISLAWENPRCKICRGCTTTTWISCLRRTPLDYLAYANMLLSGDRNLTAAGTFTRSATLAV
jgi:hypothetical protein